MPEVWIGAIVSIDKQVSEPDTEDQALAVEVGAPVPVCWQAGGEDFGGAQELRDDGERGQQPDEVLAAERLEEDEAEQRKREVKVLFDAERPGWAEAGDADVVLQEDEVVGMDGVVVEARFGERAMAWSKLAMA